MQSIINSTLGSMTIGQPDPVVGMGGTVLLYSDRNPCTIFRVFTYRKCTAVEVRLDNWTHDEEGYMTGSTVNVKGITYYFVFKDGRWKELNHDTATGKFKTVQGGWGFLIGQRQGYYDRSF